MPRRMCCPMCGSVEIENLGQSIPSGSNPNRFPRPPIQSLMQYVSSYAVMGISGAKVLRGQRPTILVIGALVGGAIGCAACLLNYAQDYRPDPTLKTSAHPQTLYQCLECEHRFAMSFEQGEDEIQYQ